MSSDFKFVHAADLHLDSPFRGLDTKSPLRDLLRESTVRAFRQVIALCLRESVDFLLLAGDLFDARDRSIRARMVLHQGLAELDRAGIQTFIVHGNHDPWSLGIDRGLSPRVKVFGPEWEEVRVERGPHLLCRVQGISYPEERVTENLSARFRREGPEFTIGLLHANLSGASAHANYAPCTPSDLAAVGLDYWALGHVHSRAELTLAGGQRAVYPGNTQGRHIHEAGERGCFLVEVREQCPALAFVPTDSVRWHLMEVGIGELERIDELVAELERRLESCLGRDGHVVRLVLTGRGPLARQLRLPGEMESLTTHLEERGLALRPPVLVESVRNESLPELDLRAIEEAGGLSGAVLDLGRRLKAEDLWSGEELKRLDTLLRGAQQPTTRAMAAELTPKAMERALELLIEGEA